MAAEKMKYVIELTAEDYRQFVRYHNLFSRKGWSYSYKFAPWVGIACFICFLVLPSQGEIWPTLHALYMVLGAILIAWPPLMGLMLEKEVYRFLKSDHSIDGVTHCYILGEEGISDRDPDGVEKLSWKNVYQAVEWKNWFFIYKNTISGFILPKREMAPQQEEQVRAMLREKLGDRWKQVK